MLIAISTPNNKMVSSIIYTIQSAIRKTISAFTELKIKVVVTANGRLKAVGVISIGK